MRSKEPSSKLRQRMVSRPPQHRGLRPPDAEEDLEHLEPVVRPNWYLSLEMILFSLFHLALRSAQNSNQSIKKWPLVTSFSSTLGFRPKNRTRSWKLKCINIKQRRIVSYISVHWQDWGESNDWPTFFAQLSADRKPLPVLYELQNKGKYEIKLTWGLKCRFAQKSLTAAPKFDIIWIILCIWKEKQQMFQNQLADFVPGPVRLRLCQICPILIWASSVFSESSQPSKHRRKSAWTQRRTVISGLVVKWSQQR